jgi:O-antigen/teichoic acid export membrane protein
MQSLISRIKLNIGANSFGQLISIIIQLTSVPILLNVWGEQLYGEWLILSAIPAYLALSDIGFGSVAANDMTMKFAKGDKLGALEVFQSTWALISALSLFFFFFIIVTLYFFPIGNLLNITEISSSDTKVILVILSIQSFISLQMGLVHAGFRCAGHYAEGYMYLSFVRLVTFLGFILGVLLFQDIIKAVLISFLIQIICFSLMVFKLLVKVPWLRYGFIHIHSRTIRNLIKPAFAFMAFPIGNAINIQGVVILIGGTLGATSVVTFTVLRTLSRLVLQLTSIINHSVWPELSKSFGEKDFAAIKKLHRKITRVNLILLIIASFCLSLSAEIIISLWTHNAVQFNSKLLYGFLLILIIESLWNTSSVIIMAINKHKSISLIYLVFSVISIVITYLLLPKFGLYSPIISMVLSYTALEIFTLNLALKISNDRFKPFLFSVLKG